MYVEFLGIPRARAGVSGTEVQAASLGQLLAELASRFPGLSDLIAGESLHSSIAANLNGDAFVKDPATPLHEADRLLILSADVGG